MRARCASSYVSRVCTHAKSENPVARALSVEVTFFVLARFTPGVANCPAHLFRHLFALHFFPCGLCAQMTHTQTLKCLETSELFESPKSTKTIGTVEVGDLIEVEREDLVVDDDGTIMRVVHPRGAVQYDLAWFEVIPDKRNLLGRATTLTMVSICLFRKEWARRLTIAKSKSSRCARWLRQRRLP